MTPAEVVLAIADQRGISLWIEQPDRIRYRGPTGVRTDDLRKLVALCRDELRQLLSQVCSVCSKRRPIMLVDESDCSLCSRCYRERTTS